MSILSDFISAVAPIARTVIGSETLSIAGGTAIAGTFNEARHSRDYEDGGFEIESSMDFVVESAILIAAYPNAAISYHGKSAISIRNIYGSETWRVKTIIPGGFFVTVGLVSTNKSA
jgi:hypothetical protein